MNTGVRQPPLRGFMGDLAMNTAKHFKQDEYFNSFTGGYCNLGSQGAWSTD